MCKIQLKEILGSNILLSDAGAEFYARLVSALANSDKVVVDMTDVSSLPSVFLNVSLGRLMDERGVEALRKGIAFERITKQQAVRLKEYITKYSLQANKECSLA